MDIKKITQFTKVFPHLCGLRLIPISLIFFMFAAKQNQLIPEWDDTIFVSISAMFLLSCWGIHLYYVKHFGRVVPEGEGCCHSKTSRKEIYFLVFLATGLLIEFLFQFPVSMIGIVAACFILFYVFILNPRPYTTSFLIFSSVLALVLISMEYSLQLFEEETIFDMNRTTWCLFTGITLFVGGFLDHFYLTQSVQPMGVSQHE